MFDIENLITTKLKKNQFDLLVTDSADHFNLMVIKSVFEERNETVFLLANNLFQAQKLYDELEMIIDEKHLSLFPADELLTTEFLAASSELRKARIQTLIKLSNNIPQIVVTHVSGLLKKQRPNSLWKSRSIVIKKGMELDQDELKNRLLEFGYAREYQTEQEGQFTSRGYIIDIFTIGTEMPIRIEFDFEEVLSVRVFDPESQRSLEEVESISIYPNHEFFFSNEEFHNARLQIGYDRQSVLVKSEIDELEHRNNLDKNHKYIGFFEHASIMDFVENPILFVHNPKRIKDTYLNMINDASDWYINQKHYQNITFDIFYDLDLLIASTLKKVTFQSVLQSDYIYEDTISIGAREVSVYGGNVKQLISEIEQSKEHYVLEYSKELEVIFKEKKVPFEMIESLNSIQKTQVSFIEKAFLSFEIDRTKFISKADIFDVKKSKKKHFTLKEAKQIKSTSELKQGDYVVHYDYGIGKYLGVTSMEIGGAKNDYIYIEYKDSEKLYVPVENINLIQKYSGSESAKPRLNSIGGSSWSKTKSRVRNKLKDIAGKLIKLYAERNDTPGFSFMEDSIEQEHFEEDFGYDETVDQLKAIHDVKTDMEAPHPMDRLLCGDVGYGKTEVAMRAAFKAVQSLKQVAYLCPTTVLSKQHYKTFQERFAKYGIRIGLLNRFVPNATIKHTIEEVKEGRIDILIGTHRLLSSDIVFQDLGLLIVDEEQRFGVEHKEKIKEMKVNVDVLTLSATPIPRTLQMSLMGVKSTSLLETPPQNRYPVQTYVIEENKSVIKDAIERELSRDGQVFVLYNRVKDIELVAQQIQQLVPDAKVTFAHGKMHREELEDTMNDFIDGMYNVLVSTTIIETGIDIPNANTLIIYHADKLGLSQLYQIRGRVGRSDRIAYAFLMYKKGNVTEEAEKRLQVIKEFTELGSGFKIALRDLNIRGAGDVLGAEQSGFIDSVGFDLYMQMLEEEIQEQQGKVIERPEQSKSSIVKVNKHIPDDYAIEEENKINLHRKIKQIKTMQDINKLEEELKDQYGYVPNDLREFMNKQLFDRYVTLFDIDQIDDKNKTIELRFSRASSDKLNVQKLMLAVIDEIKNMTFSNKNNRIHIRLEKDESSYLVTLNTLFEKMLG